MKWLRTLLLLLVVAAPLAPAIGRADIIVPPKEPPPSFLDGKHAIAYSIGGGLVVVAGGLSFVALRRIRRRNAKQPNDEIEQRAGEP